MPTAAIPGGLAPFQTLLEGTWTNQVLPNAKNGEGSPANPLSYNVMPLPQTPPNYILKNFTYFETIKFNSDADIAIPATAPNRGDTNLQAPTALFYDQLVEFAEGPGVNTVVHVENGAWLNLQTGNALVGPYAPVVLQNPNQQPPNLTVAKQMSVPHGNSILALGSFSAPTAGAPTIPNAPSVLPTPTGLDVAPYTTQLADQTNYQNPQPNLTANTNEPIQTAVAMIAPTHYITWTVSTGNQGMTMNIPFEHSASNVTAYSASYWLLSTDGGKTYPILAYTQTITMVFTIGTVHYTFPHVTTNVVTKT